MSLLVPAAGGAMVVVRIGQAPMARIRSLVQSLRTAAAAAEVIMSLRANTAAAAEVAVVVIPHSAAQVGPELPVKAKRAVPA